MTTTLISAIAKFTKTLPDSDQLHFFNKMNTIHITESNDLIQRKFRKILSQEYELERSGPFLKHIKTIQEENDLKIRENRAIKYNNTHLWITINPKSSVSLADFQKFIAKIANKTCFTDYLYVLEQRGTLDSEEITSIGKGMHCHLLVKRNINYKPCKCITNIRNSAKRIVGNINHKNQLYIVTIGLDFAKDKKDYILGKNKTGVGADGVAKIVKQDADVIWRAKNNIDPYYGSENII